MAFQGKGVIHYQTLGYGFSMTWWTVGGSASAAGMALDALNTGYLSLCTEIVVAQEALIYDVGDPVNHTSWIVQLSQTVGTFASPTGSPMHPDLSVGMKIGTAGGKQAQRFCRGFPAGFVVTGINFEPNVAWTTAWGLWVNIVLAQALYRQKVGASYSYSPVTAVYGPVPTISKRAAGRPFGQPRGRRLIA